jgi:uncharacterized protein YktA (UPF0223 family)
MEYNYPLDYQWSTEDILLVVALYNAIEKAYEEGIQKEELLQAYRGFKQVVASKGEEKQIDKEFFTITGYSIYKIMQLAKDKEWVKA